MVLSLAMWGDGNLFDYTRVFQLFMIGGNMRFA